METIREVVSSALDLKHDHEYMQKFRHIFKEHFHFTDDNTITYYIRRFVTDRYKFKCIQHFMDLDHKIENPSLIISEFKSKESKMKCIEIIKKKIDKNQAKQIAKEFDNDGCYNILKMFDVSIDELMNEKIEREKIINEMLEMKEREIVEMKKKEKEREREREQERESVREGENMIIHILVDGKWVPSKGEWNDVIEKPRKKFKNNEDDKQTECGICMDRKKEIAFSPCGHTVCRECSLLVTDCPFCRAQIENKIKLYM